MDEWVKGWLTGGVTIAVLAIAAAYYIAQPVEAEAPLIPSTLDYSWSKTGMFSGTIPPGEYKVKSETGVWYCTGTLRFCADSINYWKEREKFEESVQ